MIGELMEWGELVSQSTSYGELEFGFSSVESHRLVVEEKLNVRNRREKAAKQWVKEFYGRAGISIGRFIEAESFVNRCVTTSQYLALKEGRSALEYQIARREQEERSERERKRVELESEFKDWRRAELEELRRESPRASRELDRLQRELEEARNVRAGERSRGHQDRKRSAVRKEKIPPGSRQEAGNHRESRHGGCVTLLNLSYPR